MNTNPNTPPQGNGPMTVAWLVAVVQKIWRRINGMSGGTGGTQDLQSVTDEGSTTTQIIFSETGNGAFSYLGNGNMGIGSGDTDPGGAYSTTIELNTSDDGSVQNIKFGKNSNTDYIDIVPEGGTITGTNTVSVQSGTGTLAFLSDIEVTNPLSEDLSAGNFRITQLSAPVGMQDAANKAYVDTVAASLSWKTVVRVASTAAITGTYANGASGVGATFTVTATGILAVDGVNLVLNDRVLLRNQVSLLQNGIYTVTTAGAVGVAAILTRATDADQPAELVSAAVSTGSEGTNNANKAFIQVTPATIVVGTSDIVFNVFLNTILSPGAGIRISGNIIYNRLVEGLVGGQTVIGGTAVEDSLTLEGSSASGARLTTAPAVIINSGGTLGDNAAAQIQVSVPVTVAQSGTAGYTAMKIAVTESSTGSGTKNLQDMTVGGVSKHSISNTGLITTAGGVTMADATNIVVGTGTGTKIGTSASQKLGFFGATPIVQQSGDGATALEAYGLGALTFASAPGSGGLIGMRVLSTPGAGTYTPTSGTTSVVILAIGAGGGGGGAQGSNAQSAMAGGGGSGSWLQKRITGITGTYGYTIGTGGIAGVGNASIGSCTNGGSGGNTTFVNGGTTYTAFGGSGGTLSGSSASALATIQGGAGGTLSTNGDANTGGVLGGCGIRIVPGTGVGFAGSGGSSIFGGGGQGIANIGTVGANGTGYGSGGAGGIAVGSTAKNGGAGASGVIIVYEYK